MKEVHIGSVIRKVLQQKKVKASYLAEQLGVTRTSIYIIFRNPNIRTDTLKQIGDILGHNFFQYFISANEKGATKKDIDELLKAVQELKKKIKG